MSSDEALEAAVEQHTATGRVFVYLSFSPSQQLALVDGSLISTSLSCLEGWRGMWVTREKIHLATTGNICVLQQVMQVIDVLTHET